MIRSYFCDAVSDFTNVQTYYLDCLNATYLAAQHTLLCTILSSSGGLLGSRPIALLMFVAMHLSRFSAALLNS